MVKKLSILIWDSTVAWLGPKALRYDPFQFSFEIQQASALKKRKALTTTFNSHLRFNELKDKIDKVINDIIFQFSFEIQLLFRASHNFLLVSSFQFSFEIQQKGMVLEGQLIKSVFQFSFEIQRIEKFRFTQLKSFYLLSILIWDSTERWKRNQEQKQSIYTFNSHLRFNELKEAIESGKDIKLSILIWDSTKF